MLEPITRTMTETKKQITKRTWLGNQTEGYLHRRLQRRVKKFLITTTKIKLRTEGVSVGNKSSRVTSTLITSLKREFAELGHSKGWKRLSRQIPKLYVSFKSVKCTKEPTMKGVLVEYKTDIHKVEEQVGSYTSIDPGRDKKGLVRVWKRVHVWEDMKVHMPFRIVSGDTYRVLNLEEQFKDRSDGQNQRGSS